MAMECPDCGHSNIDGVVYCEKCGHEFGSDSERLVTGNFSGTDADVETAVEVVPEVEKPIESVSVSVDSNGDSESTVNSSLAGILPKARLIPKLVDSSIKEILLEESSMTLGTWDTDLGPVDIDMADFFGVDKVKEISRQHAQIYLEAGVWKVKDLDSLNGIYIKRSGKLNRLPSLKPEVLHSGDIIWFANIKFIFETLN